ncbi:hypothetical protein E2C01_045275 [Portunus trituberculatus]|uniref:Uncharacterized protein n=1 Tax=Portunus trituberculatus TaxID=210409 RepID=A0A5B7FUJ1_PORTR|nr:hypothetical protein [Portunus trituberculatus]
MQPPCCLCSRFHNECSSANKFLTTVTPVWPLRFSRAGVCRAVSKGTGDWQEAGKTKTEKYIGQPDLS